MSAIASPQQLSLFPGDVKAPKADTTSTFLDNMSLPIHRWFRYSAGFSALWVRELIAQQKGRGSCRVLDPFAGSGTVLLEGEFCGVDVRGTEAHPFVARMAQAKLFWRENPQAFRDFALSVLHRARALKHDVSSYPKLIQKCFPPDILVRLDALREVWQVVADGSPNSELTWLALTSILRECSPVGTAQWQYVLPNKTKYKAADPFQAFEAKVYLMSGDMALCQRQDHGAGAILYGEDVRKPSSLPDAWADLVITSPPYANNYDYADAARLEMSFWGEVQSWGDLQGAVRKYLVRSCTQHVADLSAEVHGILEGPLLKPIRQEITPVCERLAAEREHHGGKKPYHAMIAAYFSDMAAIWHELRRVTAEGALVCFVIGDSAPYGVYVPVERWLGELAIAAGFQSHTFEKTRDRNIKWKNRKHQVPLQEGRLWVRG